MYRHQIFIGRYNAFSAVQCSQNAFFGKVDTAHHFHNDFDLIIIDDIFIIADHFNVITHPRFYRRDLAFPHQDLFNFHPGADLMRKFSFLIFHHFIYTGTYRTKAH